MYTHNNIYAYSVNSSCLSKQMATSLMDYPNRSEDLL